MENIMILTIAAFAKKCINKYEIPYLVNDADAFQKFFYKEKEKNPNLFINLYFEPNGKRPRSKMIKETIYRLRTSYRIVSHSSKNKKAYAISKKILINYEWLPDDLKQEVEKVADRFYDEFVCNEAGEQGQTSKFKDITKLF